MVSMNSQRPRENGRKSTRPKVSETQRENARHRILERGWRLDERRPLSTSITVERSSRTARGLNDAAGERDEARRRQFTLACRGCYVPNLATPTGSAQCETTRNLLRLITSEAVAERLTVVRLAA
jgi:hypothetical protein